MFLAQALPKRSVPAFPELLFLGQSDPIGVRSQLYTIRVFFAKVWLPPARKGVKYGQSFTNRVSNVKTKEDFINLLLQKFIRNKQLEQSPEFPSKNQKNSDAQQSPATMNLREVDTCGMNHQRTTGRCGRHHLYRLPSLAAPF